MFAHLTASQKSAQVKRAMSTGETEAMDLSNAGRIRQALLAIGHEAEVVEVGKFRNRQPRVKVVLA